MILCNMRGAAKYYVFVVDNENDLIIKRSCFFYYKELCHLWSDLAGVPVSLPRCLFYLSQIQSSNQRTLWEF